MYTETQEALRNSLWNFMGSILSASIIEDKRKKENVTALMCEELCKFCKTEDETSVDMQAVKPILKAAVWVLEARKLEMIKSRCDIDVDAMITPMEKAIDELSNLIDALNHYIVKL